MSGYLTKGAVFGQSRFHGVQRGPTSPGRGWLLEVTNVSVTPYTYHEEFAGNEAVLSRDNLKIAFSVHTVWRIDDRRCRLFMDRYSTTVSDDSRAEGSRCDREDGLRQLRARAAADLCTRRGAAAQRARGEGRADRDRRRRPGARSGTYAQGTPFVISSVVVGNVQYPEEVARRRGPQAGRDAGAAAQGHGDRDRAEGADQARSAGAGHRQRDADHPRTTEWRCTSSTRRSRRRS